MIPQRTRRRGFLLRLCGAAPAVVAALALTACVSGGEDPVGTGSPLEEYLDAGYGKEGAADAQQRKGDEERARIEEIVAVCMAREGFDYLPDTRDLSVDAEDVFADVPWEPEAREWVTQWGYGTVDSPRDEAVAVTSPPATTEDPNEPYYLSLSDAEQRAYLEALNGPEVSDEDRTEEPAWDEQGCRGTASHELRGAALEQQSQDLSEFDGVLDRVHALHDETRNDSSQIALDREWAACMADGGYPGFTRQVDAWRSIAEEMNVLFDAAADLEAELDKSAPAVRELGRKEVALALVDLDCREETGYREEALRIRFLREEQFIQRNKDELERYKAVMEQSR